MAERSPVWVVDDDDSVRFVLSAALREAGIDTEAFADAESALRRLEGSTPALVFTDVRMPGLDGLEFLEQLKARCPQVPVVVMSAYTDVGSTAGAFRGGAHEFLSKPFDLDEAVGLARAAAGDRPDLPVAAPAASQAQSLIGESPAMADVFRAIGRLSQVPLNVLITGETGTGKELVARALHRESPRAGRPFVALNTAAIPSELLESELFGHEAGAFTGATRRYVGRFEQAEGGTLFLDEIGDMPDALQTRLLRVLAEREFFRVGGRELIRVDVRVIAATHQDLDQRARDGRFREDLLHRLDVVRLKLPPLRDRRQDIPALANHFLAVAANESGVPPKRLSEAAAVQMQAHAWPGNVRQLRNLCWRLTALAPGEVLGAADVRRQLDDADPAPAAGSSPDAPAWTSALAGWARARLAAGDRELEPQAREQLESTLLREALAHTGGHVQRAARLLGIGRNTVTRRRGKVED